jgi:hypothetical protein
MTAPLLTVIVPTIGRPTLARTLASIRDQAPALDCEILVVGDTHGSLFAGPLVAVPALAAEYGASYVGHDGGCHMVGHPQRAYGATRARGQWLLWSQDDNVLLPGAWAALRRALTSGPRLPHLFRVRTRFGYIVWDERGNLGEGRVDADCIAAPNDPPRLGTWALRYAGDQTFISETVAAYAGHAVWAEPLIADSRPGGLA